jgi:uncharacterized membrane protein
MAFALAIVTLGGVLLVALGWLGWLRKLPPNWFAGIRIPYTMRSPENWYATHHAAAPSLIFGGVAIVAAGMAFLPFSIAGKVSDGLAAAISLALAGVLLVTVLAATIVGVQSSRSRGV